MSNVLRGTVVNPDVIRGKSAYEIALMNGFEGTEQEWLASLKGDKGDKGDRGTTGKKGDPGIGLPAVTSADNGKVATVMGGAWVAFDGTYLDLTFEGELYNGRYEYNFYHVGNGIELTLGEKYKVIYDGVEYECECKGAEDHKYLGNASMATDLVNDAEDTGEPFFVWLRTYIVMTATGGEHTIKICEVEETDGIEVESAQVGQTIVVKAVDENGKPTEWEAVDLPKSTDIITADSVDELPDPSSVPEGTVALVPSDGASGGGLEVIKLTAFDTSEGFTEEENALLNEVWAAQKPVALYFDRLNMNGTNIHFFTSVPTMGVMSGEITIALFAFSFGNTLFAVANVCDENGALTAWQPMFLS